MPVKQFFDGLGFNANGFLNLSAKDAFSLCQKGACLVDIRIPEIALFKQFMVPNVLFIPFGELNREKQSIPRDIPIIIADSSGVNSKNAMKWFIDNNFENAANLAGGFVEWEHDNLPIITNIKNQLSGSCACQLKLRN